MVELSALSPQTTQLLSQAPDITLDDTWIDYVIVGAYVLFVLGIGVALRRRMQTSEDFFLSGRSLPSWVTGLAFLGANLGALEILGMGASAAQYGIMQAHFCGRGRRGRGGGGIENSYNMAVPYAIAEYFPTGMVGVGLTALLAAEHRGGLCGPRLPEHHGLRPAAARRVLRTDAGDVPAGHVLEADQSVGRFHRAGRGHYGRDHHFRAGADRSARLRCAYGRELLAGDLGVRHLFRRSWAWFWC